jgi:hypothetical protein
MFIREACIVLYVAEEGKNRNRKKDFRSSCTTNTLGSICQNLKKDVWHLNKVLVENHEPILSDLIPTFC